MARNTSVTLGEHFDEFVHEKINAGRFQSVSEVVRAGLRKLEEDEIKLQVLRDKLQAGEDSPLVEDFDGKKFVSGLHSKHLK
ncbi:MAG: type II toxin-antitoxin system ParD family antitoxin [Piscirickettsiaceae bacterium]|nr:MAG: type II toxin-antitoxin system ParD family antitoxin [Piscirickettsiaceae bacterium]